MQINFDDVLLELSYRVGIVDLTKEWQVTELFNILKENNVQNPTEIANKARVYFSYLSEATTIVKNKQTGNVYPVQNVDAKKHTIASPADIKTAKATGKYSTKEPKKPIQPKVKGKNVFGKEKGSKVFEPNKEKKSEYNPTQTQIQVFKGRKKVLLDVIEKGFLSNTEKLKKGVGVFDPSEEQLKSLVDITKKQLKNPSYRLNLPNYKIEDEDIDIALAVVKNKLGTDYKKWEQQVMKSGAVDSFLTTGEAGKQRFRDIVQKYLETGGRSAITGKFVPFNRMQLDHHVPYSSAAQAVKDKKAKGIKTTLEEEKDRLDSPPNWDLMETELNQFKNSLEGNDLIEKAAKRLNMSPDEKELKKIQQQLEVLQKDQLFSNLISSFGKKDYSGFNEESISKLNGNDANMVAKAWNYWHPNPKTPEFRDNVKNDPNYLTKLKKAGIDPTKVHPAFVYRYQAQIGGSRTRGMIKKPEDLKKSIFQAMKKEGVTSSKKESLQTNTALAKAVLSIEKQSKELTAREKELKQKIKQKADKNK